MSPLDPWMPHVLSAQPGVLRWLGRRGHDEGSAHDVWHGALEQVLDAGTRPRGTQAGSGPRAYLWTAARREAWRQERRPRPDALEDTALALPCAEHTPLEACLAEETRGEVRAAVETLPRPFRAVVVGRYFDGLSPSEVARTLSIPLNTVSSRTHRALRMLGTRLGAGANSLVVLLLSIGLLTTSLRLERAPGEREVTVASSRAAGEPRVGAETDFPYADGYHWVHQPHPEI